MSIVPERVAAEVEARTESHLKFRCPSCGARYKVGRDRLVRNSVTILCKKCRAALVLPKEVIAHDPGREWFVEIDDHPEGPKTLDEIARLAEVGRVTRSSLAWHEGMRDWKPLHEVPAFFTLFTEAR